MTGYVIDASVAFEYLLKTPLGRTVASTIDRAFLVAPELMDAEALSVLRKTVMQGDLGEERARMLVDDLIRWPVARVRHRNWRSGPGITIRTLPLTTPSMLPAPVSTAFPSSPWIAGRSVRRASVS